MAGIIHSPSGKSGKPQGKSVAPKGKCATPARTSPIANAGGEWRCRLVASDERRALGFAAGRYPVPETISDATRERITRAAMDAIRDRPPVAINAQDVAAAADVSPSAIYKAFGNKYELFAAASREILLEQAQLIRDRVDDDASPLERLRQTLEGVFYIGRDEPFAAAYVFCAFPMVYHGDAGPDVVEHARDVRAFLIEGLQIHVAAAIDAGELNGDAAMLAELCAIDTFGYVGRSITTPENVSPEQYAAFMVAGLKNLAAELSA
ncbi:MAG: TetR/AcrR family transcriptional regulator [Actinomycetota bacterium]